MSRRRLLNEEQAEQLYQEYLLFLDNRPKKLCARWGISNQALSWYVKKLHRRKAA